MAINKVNYFGQTLIDLSGDTLTSADQLLKDIVAHDKAGNIITGTLEAGGGGGGGAIPLPFTKIATGTFTLASLIYCNAYTITHNLGVNPMLFAIYHSTEGYYSGGAISFLLYLDNTNTYSSSPSVGCTSTNKYNNSCGSIQRSECLVDESSFTLNKNTYYYGSKAEYRWVAIG